MSKKTKKDRRTYTFPVTKVFPPTDLLAIDLLRLMAGYNDLAYLIGWIQAHKRIPVKPAAKTLAAGRWFLQNRLASGLLHEILDVLGTMEKLPGFQELLRSLHNDAHAALAQLTEVRQGKSRDINKFLERTRDKTTFHFDRGMFRRGLNRLVNRYGEACRSTLLVEGSEQEGRPYYILADEIRTEIAFGLTGAGGGQKEVQAIFDLMEALSVVVNALFGAYVEARGLQSEFKEKDNS